MAMPSLEQRVSTLESDVRDLRAQTQGWAEYAVSADRKAGAAGQMLSLLHRDVTAIREQLTEHNKRFDALEGRMDALEGRMDALEGRMDALEVRMDALEARVSAVEAELRSVRVDLGRMDSKLDVILERLAA